MGFGFYFHHRCWIRIKGIVQECASFKTGGNATDHCVESFQSSHLDMKSCLINPFIYLPWIFCLIHNLPIDNHCDRCPCVVRFGYSHQAMQFFRFLLVVVLVMLLISFPEIQSHAKTMLLQSAISELWTPCRVSFRGWGRGHLPPWLVSLTINVTKCPTPLGYFLK